MASMIRVLLADDHAVVRKGIRQFLEEAGDIERASRACDDYVARRRDEAGLCLLARLQLAQGLVGAAEITSQELARLHPGPAAALVRAEVAQASGEDPRSILRAAIRDWPPTLSPFSVTVTR